MADITQSVQTEGDEHYCTNCGDWSVGFSTDEQIVYVEYGAEIEIPLDDFDVDKFTKTRRICANGCSIHLDNEDDESIIDVTNGDAIWTCDECGSVFPDEDMARYCC